MRDQEFLLEYVQSCAIGTLGPTDCGPIWQMAVIAVLLMVAVVLLLVVRLRSRQQARTA